MDIVKLKSSCICGNTKPYLECCARFSDAKRIETASEPEKSWIDFRHTFHELYMYLFTFRGLYQAYWEKLSEESYPHHFLMADPEYGRAMLANFFWDYSVQFSDARPILRAARDVEAKNVRMANDFRQWSLSPLWLWYVVETDERYGYVRMLGSDKLRRVSHGGELPAAGSYIAARLLPFRGEEYVHPALLVFPGEEVSRSRTEEKFFLLCESLGLKSGAGLRPDVHCDEWRRHGSSILSLWRERTYDAVVGIPARKVGAGAAFSLSLPDVSAILGKLETGGAILLGQERFELRYRALTLARLELGEKTIEGTLMDEVFHAYVLRWLADRLGSPREDFSSGAIPPASKARMESWMHAPLPALMGETPMEASLHDFGRRRLRALLDEVSRQGRDVSLLRRRLGL